MSLFRFIFPFLYTRDWHSGEMQLSRPRVVLFSGMLCFLLLGVLIALLLQAPVKYTVSA